jgi:hypothetical protein
MSEPAKPGADTLHEMHDIERCAALAREIDKRAKEIIAKLDQPANVDINALIA